MEQVLEQANRILSLLRGSYEEEVDLITDIIKDFNRNRSLLVRCVRWVEMQNKARALVSAILTRVTGKPFTIAPRKAAYEEMLNNLLTRLPTIQAFSERKNQTLRQLRALDQAASIIMKDEKLAASCCRRSMITKSRSMLVEGILQDCGLSSSSC